MLRSGTSCFAHVAGGCNPAADLDAVKAFYGAAFGWTFVDYGPDYVAFNDSRLDGGFFRSTARSTTENGAVLVVLYGDDLEAAQTRVAEAGGVILKEIFPFPGGRRFHFADPAGTEMAVWSEN